MSVHHTGTPAGTVGPLERGFSEITNATDFKGWVVGFYGEQSKALAGVASMIADAQATKWQARYGRDSDSPDPTDHWQQRAWLVNKVRTDIAMRATKLNAQVQLTNLRAMYGRGTAATSDQRRQLELEYRTGRVCRGADRTRPAAMGETATWVGRSSRGLNCEDQRGT